VPYLGGLDNYFHAGFLFFFICITTRLTAKSRENDAGETIHSQIRVPE
jgi:hypothetical protein